MFFSNRAVLFIFDDIWEECFYNKLRKIINSAPKSCIVISTRSECIASICSSIPTSSWSELYCAQNFHRLRLWVRMGNPIKWRTWENILEILSTCKGLPLAPKLAGKTLRAEMNIRNNKIEGFHHFMKKFRKEKNFSLKGDLIGYGGFFTAVETSLPYCQIWAEKPETIVRFGTLPDLKTLFYSFSVVEKQMKKP